MTKKVGITGGIGSGKSHICRLFTDKFGILVYYSDIRARMLMEKNPDLKKVIIDEFGEDSYIDGMFNRNKFVELLFNNEESRMKMNSIVHPFVRKDYFDWCTVFNDEYILFESAILFDSEKRIEMDFNILVVADLDIRIKRVQMRNMIGVDDIMKRINSQTSDEYKRQFADYTITNNGDEKELNRQILEIHQKILSL